MENTTNSQESPTQTQIQTKSVEGSVGNIWTWLRNGNLAAFVTVLSVAAFIFNLYLTSKLLPVTQDYLSLNNTVKAQTERIDTLESTTNLYLPRYIATEQSVTTINKALDRIEAAQIRLENKIDTKIFTNK